MTHDGDLKPATIEGLVHLLDVYGADRARWPARERLRYTGFIGDNAAARRIVAEAEALDGLLDMAPEPDPARVDALAQRIMATATGGARGAARTAPAALPPAVARRAASDRLIDWPAAALLAASLMLGVFAGTSGIAEEPLQSLAALTSPESDAARDDLAAHAPFGGDEEDVL
jgi:hypothetical protein